MICQENENSRSSVKVEEDLFISKEKIANVEKQMSQNIAEDPFKHSSYFLNKDFNKAGNDYVLSQAKIRKMITEIKKELFPKEPEVVYNGNNSFRNL